MNSGHIEYQLNALSDFGLSACAGPGTDSSNGPITRIDENVGGPLVVNQRKEAGLELVDNELVFVSR